MTTYPLEGKAGADPTTVAARNAQRRREREALLAEIRQRLPMHFDERALHARSYSIAYAERPDLWAPDDVPPPAPMKPKPAMDFIGEAAKVLAESRHLDLTNGDERKLVYHELGALLHNAGYRF